MVAAERVLLRGPDLGRPQDGTEQHRRTSVSHCCAAPTDARRVIRVENDDAIGGSG